jgi:ABC-type branched-subunit amino acid transport system substrate-binding protein
LAGRQAQTTPGVTDKEIVIGSCAALEGPASVLGRETVAGAEAYFRSVKEEGGINGRKLRLVAADDSYDPAKTEACWEKLTAQNPAAAVGDQRARILFRRNSREGERAWENTALPKDCGDLPG